MSPGPIPKSSGASIESLGHAIDARLVADDVRLTMGGEPTFVSIDDPDGAEWNVAAMGPDKRPLAINLYERLKQHYAPQGLAHFGQGKWYPGEPLPRWSLTCFWRRDGEPVWRDPKLLDDERTARDVTAADAGAFLGSVAEHLGLSRDSIFPAYEDARYYAWREQQLPINVDQKDSRLDDKIERERLGRLFGKGLDEIVGHVLPIRRETGGPNWQTSPWFLRAERCYLVPGDSPLGLRLPLQSLPWVSKEDYPYTHEPDPMEPARALPRYAELRSRRTGRGASAAAHHCGSQSRQGAAAREIRGACDQDGPVRGSAQRIAAGIHAAHGYARGLSGTGGGSGGHCRGAGAAGGHRGL